MIPKELVIAPDYRSEDRIYDLKGTGWPIDALPVSDGTRENLRAWQKRWDELAWHDLGAEADLHALETGSPVDTPDGKPATPVPADVWARHDRDGRAIWAEMLGELGPDWKVGWRVPNIAGYWVQWAPGAAAEQLR